MQVTKMSDVSFISDKNILVTGAAGLVGFELIKQLLDKGYNVTAIYHSTPIDIVHPNLIIKQGDILNVIFLEEIMQNITHVYHCAALISYEPKDKFHLLKINVEGTANVVNACLDARIKKLVHVSSVAALERIKDINIVTEKMQWTEEISNSMYGKSKYLGELEVWRGIGEGLDAVIVNPSIIIGGNNWDNGSSALFKSAYNEFKYYTEGITGFVDVRDVASAMVLLMNSEISAERFILNSENISYKELFSLMAKYFSKKAPQKKVTPFMAEIVWRLESFKSLFTHKKRMLTKETANAAQAIVKYDNKKILTAFSSFSFIPLAAAIEHTCNTLKNKYHL